MATKRKSISKKVRFEVFKRDGFACQYCGATAPEVILEVDHIHPVSKDGTEDMMNYITSCKSCNAGKGGRLLDDKSAVQKQRAQLAELNERREQLEMMLKWRDGLKGLQNDQVETALNAWREAAPGWGLNENGVKGLKTHITKYGLMAVLEAMDVAHQQYIVLGEDGKATQDSVNVAWGKVGGILRLKSMPEDKRRLHYIKGILRNRFAYVPSDIVDQMDAAMERGASVDGIETVAKRARNWSEFRDWLYDTEALY